jgi:hypothetical protein
MLLKMRDTHISNVELIAPKKALLFLKMVKPRANLSKGDFSFSLHQLTNLWIEISTNGTIKLYYLFLHGPLLK